MPNVRWTWTAPTTGDTPDRYEMHRARSGSSFTSLGTTTQTSYIDADGLSGDRMQVRAISDSDGTGPFSGAGTFTVAVTSSQSAVALTAIDGEQIVGSSQTNFTGDGYYARNGFTVAANLGWDAPGYLPILDFQGYASNQAHFDRMLDMKMNGFVGHGGTDPDLAIANSMWFMSRWGFGSWEMPAPTGGFANCAWMPGIGLPEEQPIEPVQAAYDSLDPTIRAGRFLKLNNTRVPYLNNNWSGFPASKHMDFADMLCLDHYSWTDTAFFPWEAATTTHSWAWYPDQPNPNVQWTRDQRQRGGHYGRQLEWLRRANVASGKASVPLAVYTEGGGPWSEYVDEQTSYINPAGIKSAVFSQLLHGARAVMWFTHTFSGPANGSQSDFDTAYFVNNGNYAAAKQANTEALALAPYHQSPYDGIQVYGRTSGNTTGFLTAVSPSPAPLAGVEAVCHWHPPTGKHYIMAQPRTSGAQTNIAVTLTMVDQGQSSATEVLSGRTVPITNGVLTDSFANGNAYHCYRID